MRFVRDIRAKRLRSQTQRAMRRWATSTSWDLPPGTYNFCLRGHHVRVHDDEGRTWWTGKVIDAPRDLLYCEGTLLLTPLTLNPISC